MAQKIPCDKGWSWVVMFGTFICMFFVVGLMRSLGILFVEFTKAFNSSQALSAWMVGVTACVLSIMSPVANYCAEIYSSRVVVIVGAFTCATGFLLTALAPNIYYVICVLGTLTGFGSACMFGPSLMMIGVYFEKRRSLANACSLTGSSVGCLTIPPLLNYLVEEYTVWGALVIFSGLVLHGCIAALFLTPPSFYTNGNMCCPASFSVPSISHTTEKSEKEVAEKLDKDSTTLTSNIHTTSKLSLHSQNLNNSPLNTPFPLYPKDKKLLVNENISSSCDRIYSKNTECSSQIVSSTTEQLNQSHKIQNFQGSTKSLDHSHIKKHEHKGIDKNLLLIKKVDDHYTSRESLFIVEGQAVPKNLIQEELKLNKDKSCVPVNSTYENKCGQIPLLGNLCKIFQWQHLQNPLFVLFCVSLGIGNASYLDHFIIIPPHCADLHYSGEQAAMLLSIAGALDIVGRLTAGWFGDMNVIKRWKIISTAMIITGTSTTICSFFKVFPSLITLCVVLGFVSGIHLALFTVVLIDFVGLDMFPGAFGLFLLFLGIFNSTLPSFLGYLRDLTGSYQASFLTVGILMAFSGAILWIEPLARKFHEKLSVKTRQR